MPNINFKQNFSFFKISTWLIAILLLLLFIAIAFLLIFPHNMKSQIENKFANTTGINLDIESLSFEFIDNEFLLAAHGIEVAATDLSPVLSIDVVRWNFDIYNLIKGNKIPEHITINEIIVDIDVVEPYIALINSHYNDIFNNRLYDLLALEYISIKKTIISGENEFLLAPIEFKKDKQKITVSMNNQELINNFQTPKISNTIDIKTSIDVNKAKEGKEIVLPFSIEHDDFTISAQLKIFSVKEEVFFELESYIDEISVDDIKQNIPEALVNTKIASRLRQYLSSGIVKNAALKIRSNLSAKQQTPTIEFSADLYAAELKMNSKWAPITALNAQISFANNQLNINGKDAKIADIDIGDLNISAANLSDNNTKIMVRSRINSSSQKVASFIKKSPASATIKEFINQFELQGDIWGDLIIEIPFYNNADSKVQLGFDMFVTDNKLNFLKDKIKVDHYSSQISYHNKILQTKGNGNIGGLPFDLEINPDEWINNSNSKLKMAIKRSDGELVIFLSKEGYSKWHAQVDSKHADVDVYIYPHAKGLAFVELQNLRITGFEEIKSPWSFLPSDFPSFNLISKNATINGVPIPNFEVGLISKEQAMQIQNLKLEGIGISDKELIFNGNWIDGKTTLKAKASHRNLSDFLEKLGIKEPVIGGKFNIDVNLYCACMPWEMYTKNTNGLIKLDIKKGVFTDQDPGVFKLLSIINIDSIASRMKLDKSKLNKQGFNYDRISIGLLLEDAKIKIDNFQIDSKDSEIKLSGYLDLINFDYKLSAHVKPFIADSVPMATYILGGGLSGLAVWITDKLLFSGEIVDEFFNNIIEFNYTITGSWFEPIVQLQTSD